MRPLILFAAVLTGCGGGDVFTGGVPSPASPPAGGNAVPQSVSLRNIVRTQDAVGDIRILGEAVTNSPRPLTFVKVTCTFKDQAGASLGTEFTYVLGRVVSVSGINSNTALGANDIGYFDIITSRKNSTIASYECAPSFNNSTSTEPTARLEVQGTPTVTSDFLGYTMYLGSVKNSGKTPLVFGQVYAVTFSPAGLLIDISMDYISGQTGVTAAGTTDTALAVESIGRFEIDTLSSYGERGSNIYMYDWDDTASLSAASSLTPRARMNYEDHHALRNKKIESLIDN